MTSHSPIPVGVSSPFPRKIRIALVADTHTNLARHDDEARYKTRLDRTIAAVNAANAAFVLVAGDLTQRGSPAQAEAFRSQIKRLERPVMLVPGNHDVGDKAMAGKQGQVTNERIRTYEDWFGASYLVRSLSGVRVIGINSSLLGSGLPEEVAQWSFLHDTLLPAQATPTLILMHYPPYVESPEEVGDYWNIDPAPRLRFLDLIVEGGVGAILTGHLHRPLRASYRGIPIIGSLPVSFAIPAGEQPVGWTLIEATAAGKLKARSETITG